MTTFDTLGFSPGAIKNLAVFNQRIKGGHGHLFLVWDGLNVAVNDAEI